MPGTGLGQSLPETEVRTCCSAPLKDSSPTELCSRKTSALPSLAEWPH
jgi:hypothetical protein